MRENDVTELLVHDALAGCSAEVTSRFVAEVCGVRPPPVDDWLHLTQVAAWEDFGQSSGAVIGIAPSTTVGGLTSKTGPGSTIDGLIVGNGLLVLVEVKTNLDQCEWPQLVRHARKWALDVPPDMAPQSSADLPAGFGVTTWETVGGWLNRELARSQQPQDDQALRRLAEALSQASLCSAATETPAAKPVEVVDTNHPVSTPLDEILRDWDLDAVSDVCQRLYGPQGSHSVSGSGCVGDAAAMIAAYRDAGLEPLHGLRNQPAKGPMTPRRVLTALYGGDGRLNDASPGDWTVLSDRVLARGGDKDVLIAMLAWARARSGAASRRILSSVPLAWSLAPDTASPGMRELTGGLDPFRPR